MAEIELPPSSPSLTTAEDHAARRPSFRGRASRFAGSATLVWFLVVVIWVTRAGGPAMLADETLAALVAALGGVVTPVILLWLILLLCSRDRLAPPDPSGDARVQTMAAALRRQADLAREATEHSIAALDAARERLADTARENDVSLDRRAEVLRNVAEEANSRAMAGAAAPDERARSLARATETIAYHHRDLVVGLERRGELFDAQVGEAVQRAREVGLIDEASIRSRAGENARSGRGRSHEGKLSIAGAVEVGDETAPGRIRLATIEDFSAETLHRFVANEVEPGSLVKTDGWRACNKAEGVLHLPHVVGPQPAHLVMPWIHRVFSLFKTWALGVYHGLRPKHLQTYLDEFVF